MKKRHVMRALVAAATALALTACGSTGSSDTSKSTSTAATSTSSGSEADTENTITIPAGESVSQDSDVTAMVAVDFTTMDPMDTSDTLSGGVQRMMMDGLFGFDENMQIIPMLATSYEANDEATEYTIHLREGVSFTDGTPWNADALIANVNKWADKSLGLKRTTFLCNVLDHAEKVDDYTVTIYLAQSFGAFISNLAHPATLIMSPKQIEAGEDLVTLVTCTPYGINTHRLLVTGKRVEYKKVQHDAIKQEIPSIRELIFFILPFMFAAISLGLYFWNRRETYEDGKI